MIKWQSTAIFLLQVDNLVYISPEVVVQYANLIRLAAKSLQQVYSEIKSKVDPKNLVTIEKVTSLLSTILPFYLNDTGKIF